MRRSFKIENFISQDIGRCLNKHYTLSRNENYDKFLHELGVSKIVAARAAILKPTVTLSKENHEYILTTAYSGAKTQAIKFRLGEKVSKQLLGGPSVISIFKMRGATLTETGIIGGKKVRIAREFGLSFLKVTMKVKRVKCLRIYRSSESKHSIQTETSRRGSLIWTATIPEDLIELEVEDSPRSTTQDVESDICF